jgi:hypothetical protein
VVFGHYKWKSMGKKSVWGVIIVIFKKLICILIISQQFKIIKKKLTKSKLYSSADTPKSHNPRGMKISCSFGCIGCSLDFLFFIFYFFSFVGVVCLQNCIAGLVDKRDRDGPSCLMGLRP